MKNDAIAAVALPDCTDQLRPVKATCCAGGLQIPDPSSLQLGEQDDHDLHICFNFLCLTEIHDVFEIGLDEGSTIQNVTRVELAKMIAVTEELSLDASESSFSDVSADHWGLQYIEACVEAGIVNGYTDGTFLPANNVTRAEAAAMIARALGLAE